MADNSGAEMARTNSPIQLAPAHREHVSEFLNFVDTLRTSPKGAHSSPLAPSGHSRTGSGQHSRQSSGQIAPPPTRPVVNVPRVVELDDSGGESGKQSGRNRRPESSVVPSASSPPSKLAGHSATSPVELDDNVVPNTRSHVAVGNNSGLNNCYQCVRRMAKNFGVFDDKDNMQ